MKKITNYIIYDDHGALCVNVCLVGGLEYDDVVCSFNGAEEI